MAESVMADLIKRNGFGGKIMVDSAATHRDEIGNIPHFGTVKALEKNMIPLIPHRARLMTKTDGETFDLLIGMDKQNIRDMARIADERNLHKLKLLLSFCGDERDVADPWYTGDFEKTFEDISRGCRAVFAEISKANKF